MTNDPRLDDPDPIDPDEGRYSACSCGVSGCLLDGDDPSNVRVQGRWYNVECAAELAAVIEGREREAKADEARDDDFDQVRR